MSKQPKFRIIGHTRDIYGKGVGYEVQERINMEICGNTKKIWTQTDNNIYKTEKEVSDLIARLVDIGATEIYYDKDGELMVDCMADFYE